MTRKIDGNTLFILNNDNSVVLSLQTTPENILTTLKVSGSITHEAAPEFEDELMSILTSGSGVALDFTFLEYISASALDTLLTVQKLVDEKRYTFYIKGVSEAARASFKQTGFIDVIDIRE